MERQNGRPEGPWCNDNTNLVPGSMGTAIGTGATNTANMLAVCTSGAASLVAAYTSPNFDTSPPVSTTTPMVPTVHVPASAPMSVRAGASRGSATVIWRAPSSDWGSPITRYIVSADPGGRGCSTSRFTCTVTGLRDGRYTFSVTARNGVGLGDIGFSKSVLVTRGSTRLRSTAPGPTSIPLAIIGGKSDWYLPSKDKLILMYLDTKSKYWSSSQNSATTAWQDDFSAVTSYGVVSYSILHKSSSLFVRPIRAF